MNAEALHDYLARTAGQPARLGTLDCVRFVAEALHVGWGRDYRDLLHYSDRKSAVTQLRQAGGLYEAVCQALGQDIPVTDLEPGDIAWFPDPCIGLILPDCIAVKYRSTVLRAPRNAAYSGWKT